MGVVFVNAASNDVIWHVCREVSVLGALREIAQLLGVNIWEIQLCNEIGPLLMLDKTLMIQLSLSH